MRKKYQINENEFTTKEKIQYGLLSILVLGGSFFIGRKMVKTAKSNTEEKKTFVEGSAATYAKQIKMAFDNDNYFGWGTDEAALRKTIKAIASKDEFRKVINSYQSLYDKSMMKDMQEELTTTEYNEMLSIIAGKPERANGSSQIQIGVTQYQAWARRLKAAFDIKYGPFPGTDEDAIKAVFMEIPTQAVFAKVVSAYNIEFNKNMLKDLQTELEFWEFKPMMQIIYAKPKR